MFDKFKARVEKLEETNETFRNAKAHVEKYQVVYAVVGSSVVTILVMRAIGTKPQITTIVNEFAPVNNNLPIFSNTVNNGGYARKIIRCLETDELWSSMTKAAEATGNNLRAMSKHIHGGTEHLDGLHYVIEGVTAA